METTGPDPGDPLVANCDRSAGSRAWKRSSARQARVRAIRRQVAIRRVCSRRCKGHSAAALFARRLARKVSRACADPVVRFGHPIEQRRFVGDDRYRCFGSRGQGLPPVAHARSSSRNGPLRQPPRRVLRRDRTNGRATEQLIPSLHTSRADQRRHRPRPPTRMTSPDGTGNAPHLLHPQDRAQTGTNARLRRDRPEAPSAL